MKDNPAAMSGQSGLHESFERDEETAGSSDRGFGFVFAGFFALIGAIKLYNDSAGWPYWLAASAAFLAAALLTPGMLGPLNRLWLKIALVLYKIMNPLTMGLLFFLVMTPMGVAMRAFGKDFLKARFDKGAASYWVRREPPGPEPESMKQQF
jgi:hypothetical protein